MARIKKNVIIILWDYTESSWIALQHGVQLAKEVNNQVMISRFIESPGIFTGRAAKEKLAEEEKEKLKEVGRQISEKYNINPFISVEVGINKKQFLGLIEDAKANLIIVGDSYKLNDKTTFQLKDIVKKLKVLDIPFIIPTEAPVHNYYKEIVVPLDHDKKYKETLHWVVYLSKYYNCNVNLMKPFIEDEKKKKDMANNVYFTKKTLDKKSIIYGIKTAKKNKQFDEEIFKFSEIIDADLTVMMVKPYYKFLLTHPKHTQHIPIMVINRNNKIIKYGGGFR